MNDATIYIPQHKPQCVAEYLYYGLLMTWEQAKRLTTSYRLPRPGDHARMAKGEPKAWEAGDPEEWDRPREIGLYSSGMVDVDAEVLEEFARRQRDGHPITTCPSVAQVWDRAKVEAVMAEHGLAWHDGDKKSLLVTLEYARKRCRTASEAADYERRLDERARAQPWLFTNPIDR